MSSPRIGLLPLYLVLYDQALPESRKAMDAFYAKIADALEKRGLDVTTVPLCRLESEFIAAIKQFEDAGVDAIVTLHLAYSPSLESAKALAATSLPLIVLDTTPTFAFGPATPAAEIMGNHGIHGVQDMCNLLIRNGKSFQIEAGHWQQSDVIERTAAWARAAKIATAMRTARVGLYGEPFRGMGDFAVPEATLRRTIGIEVVHWDAQASAALLPAEDDASVEQEIAADRKAFMMKEIDDATHRRSVVAGLAVRRWLAQQQLTAFSINFLAVNRETGLPTMPFLEISKAMARGIGYAGEGDVLTAALVGALAASFPQTTFTEMFCPDWQGESVFLSHMGEMNIALTAGRPLLMKKPFPWSDVAEPAVAVGRLRGGNAVLVNLAPGPDDSYTLVVCPGEMLGVKGPDAMPEVVRGWFRPQMPLHEFLAEYSRVGGTHHSALVYGDALEEILRFGDLMGWPIELLSDESDEME